MSLILKFEKEERSRKYFESK